MSRPKHETPCRDLDEAVRAWAKTPECAAKNWTPLRERYPNVTDKRWRAAIERAAPECLPEFRSWFSPSHNAWYDDKGQLHVRHALPPDTDDAPLHSLDDAHRPPAVSDAAWERSRRFRRTARNLPTADECARAAARVINRYGRADDSPF